MIGCNGEAYGLCHQRSGTAACFRDGVFLFSYISLHRANVGEEQVILFHIRIPMPF